MSGVQSVGRAFSLLEAVGSEPASLTELARRVGLPISTASRLLATLESLGAIERLDDVGMYRIGPSIVKMASSIDSSASLSTIAQPELEQLARLVREACGLSVAAGYTMHYINQIDSDQPIQVRDWVGIRIPLHLISAGLVVMAHWPDEAVDSFLERDLYAPTTRSVTDPTKIRDRLARIREQGVAWTAEELELGITSCSAPVFNGNGEIVCAVSVHGPSFRFPGNNPRKIETELVRAASRISETLGPL